MARKKFSADYEASDILGLYQSKLAEGDESRLRAVSQSLREHCRLEHAVSIPEQYRAISKEIRTPYLRDAWSRISASLVSKPPVIHCEPKDDKRENYREASNVAERFDSAMLERLNKETGEDTLYAATAALVRDGESVLKVVHKPDAWANFPRLGDEDDPRAVLQAQDDYKKGADLPLAWRCVDRLQMMFSDGEYGDDWALEYGEYPLPYLRRNLGLVFQDQKLLFDRNAFENVMLPLAIAGFSPREAAKRVRAALDKVGLLAREKALPIALSGGEQQRLAIARAVVNRPGILLTDEPTAHLDPETARDVANILRDFHQVGVTLLIASYDNALFAPYATQRLTLSHGKLLT